MTLNNPYVDVRNVRRTYGDDVAVDDVSFQITRGEVFGLLGPNGAGKTTLLRILNTVLPADEGDVTIDGLSVRNDPAGVRARIGVCPQSLAIYEDLTGRENLVFFARLAGLSGAEANASADEFLGLVGLTDRGGDRASKYSGGMKRRLNFAISLVARPDLVLLDEPTVGVDPQSRNHIFETVGALNEQGMTVIYTTHYMEEADRLCDRILIMDRGRVVTEGTSEELKTPLGDPQTTTLEDVFLHLTGRTLRE